MATNKARFKVHGIWYRYRVHGIGYRVFNLGIRSRKWYGG
jgi:hypothetical protein